METYYILDTTEEFNGSVFNSIQANSIDEANNYALVDYVDKITFAEYNQQHGGKLIIIDRDALLKDYVLPYRSKLQGPFEEIPLEKYYDLMECVPPLRMQKLGSRYYMFFVGECYSFDLYHCCVRNMITDVCYYALRAVETPNEKLLEEFEKLYGKG